MFFLFHSKHPFTFSIYLTECWKVGIWSWRDVSPDTVVKQERVKKEVSRWTFAKVEVFDSSFKKINSMGIREHGSWVNSGKWNHNLAQLWLVRNPSRISIRTLFSCFFFSGKKHIDDAWLISIGSWMISIGSWMNFCSCETKTRTLMSSLYVNLHKPRSFAPVFGKPWWCRVWKVCGWDMLYAFYAMRFFTATSNHFDPYIREDFFARTTKNLCRQASLDVMIISCGLEHHFPFQDMPRCFAWCCQQQMCGTNSSKQTS